jgi:hypothetical protein
MFNVIDCIKTMFFTPNKLDKMMTLNYNIVNIHNINVCCLLVNLNSDVLLSYHPCVNQHGILIKCREWIKSTTTAFGARWRQPTLQMTLDWVFKVDALPSPKLGPRWASVSITTKLWRLEGTLPALSTKRGRGAWWSFGMGLGQGTSFSYSLKPASNQPTSWLVRILKHPWC